MTEEEKNIAINLLIEKANRNFEQARFLANSGFWDLIVNRLYYSLFHAVTALMMQDNIVNKSHKGTAQQFGKHYVMTEKFDKEDGRFYNRLQEKREKADYDNVFSLSEEEGMELIQKTEALLTKILNRLIPPFVISN